MVLERGISVEVNQSGRIDFTDLDSQAYKGFFREEDLLLHQLQGTSVLPQQGYTYRPRPCPSVTEWILGAQGHFQVRVPWHHRDVTWKKTTPGRVLGQAAV